MKKAVLLWMLLFCCNFISKSQYFNKLYDYDSTQEWGLNILNYDADSYKVLCGFVIPNGNSAGLYISEINSQGVEFNKKSVLINDSIYYEKGTNAQIRTLSKNKGYIMPVNIGYHYPNRTRVIASIYRITANGDSVLLKGHTDTAIYKEFFWSCDTTANGDYLLCGHRLPNGGTFLDYIGLIQRLDSNGNLVWSKTFQGPDNLPTDIFTVEYLQNGNILVGAITLEKKTVQLGLNFQTYYMPHPWSLILDSAGNIIRQKYTSGRYGGGQLAADKNGGYYRSGAQDTFLVNQPYAFQNFPCYVAHLNDSFEIDRVYDFADINGDIDVWNMQQTKDSGYIITGKKADLSFVQNRGWAAKFDKYLNLKWENTYYVDSNFIGYLIHAYEGPDGGFVMTGMHMSAATLASGRYQDAWVVSVDSMGCPSAECAFPTDVPDVAAPASTLALYPNPTAGSFTLSSTQSGLFIIYSLQGTEVMRRQVAKGATKIELPETLAAGVYIGRLQNRSNNDWVRFVYQP